MSSSLPTNHVRSQGPGDPLDDRVVQVTSVEPVFTILLSGAPSQLSAACILDPSLQPSKHAIECPVQGSERFGTFSVSLELKEKDI